VLPRIVVLLKCEGKRQLTNVEILIDVVVAGGVARQITVAV